MTLINKKNKKAKKNLNGPLHFIHWSLNTIWNWTLYPRDQSHRNSGIWKQTVNNLNFLQNDLPYWLFLDGTSKMRFCKN